MFLEGLRFGVIDISEGQKVTGERAKVDKNFGWGKTLTFFQNYREERMKTVAGEGQKKPEILGPLPSPPFGPPTKN